jgi:hypothetical protein
LVGCIQSIISHDVTEKPESADEQVLHDATEGPLVSHERVTLSGDVVNSADEEKPVSIPLDSGINVIYRGGEFFYTTERDVYLEESVSMSVYHSGAQGFNLGVRNNVMVNVDPSVRNPKNMFCAARPDRLVPGGVELKLHNLYRVEQGDTLNSVAKAQLGNEKYAAQLAYVNKDLAALSGPSGVINDVIALTGMVGPVENAVDLNKEIPFGMVIRLPLQLKLKRDIYKQRGEAADSFLTCQFYGYTSDFTLNKFREWKKLGLLTSRRDGGFDENGGEYIYMAAL